MIWNNPYPKKTAQPDKGKFKKKFFFKIFFQKIFFMYLSLFSLLCGVTVQCLFS